MNKEDVITAVIGRLEETAGRFHGAARRARDEAVHEESQAEDKYDTRGLEASYLAAGQSRQMAETQEALESLAGLPRRSLSGKEPVDVGALVQVEMDGSKDWYLLGSAGGGTEVKVDGETVTVLTLESPLGTLLAGRRQGERFRARLGGEDRGFRILAIC